MLVVYKLSSWFLNLLSNHALAASSAAKALLGLIKDSISTDSGGEDVQSGRLTPAISALVN